MTIQFSTCLSRLTWDGLTLKIYTHTLSLLIRLTKKKKIALLIKKKGKVYSRRYKVDKLLGWNM